MPDIHRSLKFIFRAPRRSKSAVFHPDICSNSFLQTQKIVMILLVSFFLPFESALPCSCYLRCSLCSRLNYFCKNTRVVFHYRHTGFTSRLHRDLCKMSRAASRGALMWISCVKWNQKAVKQHRGTWLGRNGKWRCVIWFVGLSMLLLTFFFPLNVRPLKDYRGFSLSLNQGCWDRGGRHKRPL